MPRPSGEPLNPQEGTLKMATVSHPMSSSRRTTSSEPRPPDPEDADRGRRRVVIEGLTPQVDAGRFAAKTIAGDLVRVEADVFTDGHDGVRAVVLHRDERERTWREAPMEPIGNDRFRARFEATEIGRYVFTVLGWVDRFGTWRSDLHKRIDAGQDVSVDLSIGANLIEEAAAEAEGPDASRLLEGVELLRRAAEADEPDLESILEDLDGELGRLALLHDPRRFATRYPAELEVVADRPKARFSAWYEFFPRSTGPDGEHGTFETATRFLPYVKQMGFDVVYLPPIHPVGTTKRKGPNNRPEAEPGEPGSPWGIGSEEGGHTSVHPDLGTLDDFRGFRERVEELEMEVALDVAFQVSPDHPWVSEHPEWFRARPDGTIQYAENPPKKYQDIYPIDFESEDWESLWKELRGVFAFWAEEGVRIFRVDNPHTKAFPFWEWCIGSLKREYPDLIFLSEAFTRPKVMYRLAKLGFTQSYTYFAWRNEKQELTEYVRELAHTEVHEFFRPNFWPNTPDILTEYLQTGGRPAFMIRLVLAATLTASYGIYGPAFELLEWRARDPGSEEYLDSEKYQVRDWDLDREDSLAPMIARVNHARRENPAFHRNEAVHFHPTDNDEIIAYSKRSVNPDGSPGANRVLVVVNLDPHHTQSGWIDVQTSALGLEDGQTYQVHDLLGGARYLWHPGRNYVEMSPHVLPAHVFRVERRERTERDFDAYR